MKLTVWKTNCCFGDFGGDFEEKMFKTPEAAIKYLSGQKQFPTLPNPKWLRYTPSGFGDCNCTITEFNNNIYNRKSGYFQISSGEPTLETKITENQEVMVTWKYPIFVQFFKAHYFFQPELKRPGEPYRPEINELMIDAKSEKFPLFRSYDDYSYSSDMGSWQRGVPVISEVNLYASKIELDILE